MGACSFSSLFILDVATQSQKDHKLFSTTYNLCSKKISNKKIEGSLLRSLKLFYLKPQIQYHKNQISKKVRKLVKKNLFFCALKPN